MSYLERLARRPARQPAPIPGSGQVRNGSGGFAWAAEECPRLRRFPIIGTGGGSFSEGEWNLTRENAQADALCIDADGPPAVTEIVAVSEGDRAPRQLHAPTRTSRASRIEARLVLVGEVSNGFTIAAPNAPGMLDVVGFDTATQRSSDFARGDL
jgi:hypothetical protein